MARREGGGGKRRLGIDVLTAARQRVAWAFETFPRLYVSFSAGKDSTVMLHLVGEEATRRGRRVGVLFIDLEAQYRLTIEHAREMLARYAGCVECFWVALPLNLRNAVSVFETHWLCWDPGARPLWVREPPPEAIVDEGFFPFFRRGMEFEEFVPAFADWYAGGRACGCFVGIRADESLNRYRTVVRDKSRFEGRGYTTWKGGTVVNIYPLYDWKTEDVWVYHGTTGLPYNRIYDRMYQAGLSIHQARICQPYGDDQRRGLWLFHAIEPETWGRVVARVAGANGGALYARETGNVNGMIRVSRPPGHTWESFARLLLASLPERTREHYENKIAVFCRWWMLRGYPNGIPEESDPALEAARKAPSWRRIVKALLRNDYWCKGLSFTQHKSTAYEQYRRVMQNRRREWGI